ncbi:hypothetical protein [Streptosporangium sp. NPDC023615]|uniref:hypothetical protein n=1 Tax=Streptosporangium sp. NPDC023615 TaxID=3154794 RepID=UPI0034410F82
MVARLRSPRPVLGARRARIPWGASDPDLDRELSVLAGAVPDPGGWWIAAFGALGLLVSLALTLTGGRGATGRVPLFLAWPGPWSCCWSW